MISDTHCFNGVAKVNVFSNCAKFFSKSFKKSIFDTCKACYSSAIMDRITHTDSAKVSLWKLATVFTKIGMFTLGGGYAMIPLIDHEVVQKRRWLGSEEFYDILSIAQSSPGLLIVNISIFAGYRLRGRKGSVAATIGSCLPSFLIILAIALFFAGYRNNIYVDKIFKGIRPVVVALIAVPVVDMIQKSHLNIWRALLAVATAVAIIFLKVSPIYILLVFFVCFFCTRYLTRRQKTKEETSGKATESLNAETSGTESPEGSLNEKEDGV